jgi:hypothetical protein
MPGGWGRGAVSSCSNEALTSGALRKSRGMATPEAEDLPLILMANAGSWRLHPMRGAESSTSSSRGSGAGTRPAAQAALSRRDARAMQRRWPNDQVRRDIAGDIAEHRRGAGRPWTLTTSYSSLGATFREPAVGDVARRPTACCPHGFRGTWHAAHRSHLRCARRRRRGVAGGAACEPWRYRVPVLRDRVPGLVPGESAPGARPR